MKASEHWVGFTALREDALSPSFDKLSGSEWFSFYSHCTNLLHSQNHQESIPRQSSKVWHCVADTSASCYFWNSNMLEFGSIPPPCYVLFLSLLFIIWISYRLTAGCPHLPFHLMITAYIHFGFLYFRQVNLLHASTNKSLPQSWFMWLL